VQAAGDVIRQALSRPTARNSFQIGADTVCIGATVVRAVVALAPPWTTGAESGSDGKRSNA